MSPAERDRVTPIDTIAAEEARTHESWSEGMTPSEYLLALVDRAQARKTAAGS